MVASDIYSAIDQFIRNHDHKFRNVYVHAWEADQFSVTSTRYSYEIEVKVSRSDFKADFKKPKHHFFRNIRNGYSILPEEESYSHPNWVETGRYPELKNFKVVYTNIRAVKVDHTTCPNRFFFACPVGLIEACEVPAYAGLLYIMDSKEIRVIKKAPLIHDNPFIAKEVLFDKYMWAYLNLKNGLEREVKRLRKFYEEHQDTRTEKTNNIIT